jgi:hypothetical protein
MRRSERALWCGLGLVVGLMVAASWRGTPAVAAEQDQPVQVMVDEKDLRLVYANAYRIHTAEQEAVIDFGFNMPNPNPPKAGEKQVLLKISDRVVLSYVTTKRLAVSLDQLVKRFEKQFGEIPLAPK